MKENVRAEKKSSKVSDMTTGELKIGDNWNAITIIALSQNNPLKAIAEFVENSIDAQAKHITIVRGKEKGEHYLKVIDDGTGIPFNSEGTPDFRYVATHICDSIKKRLKKEGIKGIQGEFGIGLLSFWTVGEKLTMTSGGDDGKTYQMEMRKNQPGYSISQKRSLFPIQGTELVIHPLLPGIKQLTGEKVQNYLASELRDRIKSSGVKIRIKDRSSRKEFDVEPRQFEGKLLHEFEPILTPEGEIYFELYLNAYNPENRVGLYRLGTRVLPSITSLDQLNRAPWSSGYLQGMIDVPFLNLTPGTRDGIIRDEQFMVFYEVLESVEEALNDVIEEEKKAAEEKVSRDILKSVQRALKEAFLVLPKDDYDWLDIYAEGIGRGGKALKEGKEGEEQESVSQKMPQRNEELGFGLPDEREFYEHAGPLYKAIISPSTLVIPVGTSKNLRVIPRDRKKHVVEHNIEIAWEIKEGKGSLQNIHNEVVSFKAPNEPGITIVQATVTQNEIVCTAESIITITDSLIEKDEKKESGIHKGLPGYTFKRAPGELWRSYYDEKNNIVIINNGHADYIYASSRKALKVKYICKLFAKELVLKNFLNFTKEELLERMVELTLYTEEHLK